MRVHSFFLQFSFHLLTSQCCTTSGTRQILSINQSINQSAAVSSLRSLKDSGDRILDFGFQLRPGTGFPSIYKCLRVQQFMLELSTLMISFRFLLCIINGDSMVGLPSIWGYCEFTIDFIFFKISFFYPYLHEFNSLNQCHF